MQLQHQAIPAPGSILIRAGDAADQGAIDALIAGERLNPNDIRAENFIVAVDGGEIVGAAQVRRHPDGARELGSLVVRADHRGRGISGRLIETLLAREATAVFMITGSSRAHTFARFGFVPAGGPLVPRSIRTNRMKGQIYGGLAALTHFRRPQRLVILCRP
ncbi:MAG: GNAT family N-acetyltransferase [Hyphomicrobiales bacterium]|nr:GNAT family N-acetyltransferase [Hyphomicrobiales bacterium]